MLLNTVLKISAKFYQIIQAKVFLKEKNLKKFQSTTEKAIGSHQFSSILLHWRLISEIGVTS